MRFAIVNNQRVEAEPKLKGTCPGCEQPVIAKCGTKRIKHWAHSPKKPCTDRWWEPETEWHRNWKNNFPVEWQEYIQRDPSGEKHIADVRTAHGLVIEFQYSRLDPQERAVRERFYGNMVWVADGTRRKKDYERFLKGMAHAQSTNRAGFFLVPAPDKCFPADWIESTVPVLFDFQSIALTNPQDTMSRECVWCLLPGHQKGNAAIVIRLPRKQFIDIAHTQPQLLAAPKSVSIPRQHAQAILNYQNLVARQRAMMRPRRRARF